MGLQSFDVDTPLFGRNTFASTDTVGIGKTIVGTQLRNALIQGIFITNNDTIAHNITIHYTVSSTAYYLGSVAVPAGSGTLGVAAVDALHALFPFGTPNLAFPTNATLQAFHEEAVTALKAVTVVALVALVG